MKLNSSWFGAQFLQTVCKIIVYFSACAWGEGARVVFAVHVSKNCANAKIILYLIKWCISDKKRLICHVNSPFNVNLHQRDLHRHISAKKAHIIGQNANSQFASICLCMSLFDRNNLITRKLHACPAWQFPSRPRSECVSLHLFYLTWYKENLSSFAAHKVSNNCVACLFRGTSPRSLLDFFNKSPAHANKWALCAKSAKVCSLILSPIGPQINLFSLFLPGAIPSFSTNAAVASAKKYKTNRFALSRAPNWNSIFFHAT
jgi:hypothetical protein